PRTPTPPTPTLLPYTTLFRSSRRQSAALRSDPPIAQRLDREDNREPTGHSEDIQSPDEQQGAALLEKLRAQSIPHVQRQHADGQDRKSTRLNSSHLGISYAVF